MTAFDAITDDQRLVLAKLRRCFMMASISLEEWPSRCAFRTELRAISISSRHEILRPSSRTSIIYLA